MFFPFRCRTSHPNSVAFSKYEPFIASVAGLMISNQQTVYNQRLVFRLFDYGLPDRDMNNALLKNL